MDPIHQQTFRRLLEKHGVQHHVDEIVGQLQPSVRLFEPEDWQDSADIVTTRLGGLPDLPAGFVWPWYDEEPLSFIAQVRLEEVAALPGANALPPAGLLSFFYAVEASPWGFNSSDRGGWHVSFTPPGPPLERMEPPEEIPDEGRFTSVGLRPTTEPTPLHASSLALFALDIPSAQMDSYWDAVGNLARVTGRDPDSDERIHRLLGHPDPIQGDMTIECQIASSGVEYDEWMQQTQRVAEAEPGFVDWRLLLQVDSSEAAGMMWGDVGRLYYWIRAQDLAAQRFDRVWLVLQCF